MSVPSTPSFSTSLNGSQRIVIRFLVSRFDPDDWGFKNGKSNSRTFRVSYLGPISIEQIESGENEPQSHGRRFTRSKDPVNPLSKQAFGFHWGVRPVTHVKRFHLPVHWRRGTHNQISRYFPSIIYCYRGWNWHTCSTQIMDISWKVDHTVSMIIFNQPQ